MDNPRTPSALILSRLTLLVEAEEVRARLTAAGVSIAGF